VPDRIGRPFVAVLGTPTERQLEADLRRLQQWVGDYWMSPTLAQFEEEGVVWQAAKRHAVALSIGGDPAAADILLAYPGAEEADLERAAEAGRKVYRRPGDEGRR
jgi:hypothetical protein